MSRRALSPAARGVSLAVLAALRGGRVDLADQADGTTLATSTAPDGTELLRAVVRLPVRGHDPRQLTLPAVAPVPQPAEVPPAPVATPAGEVPAQPEPEAPPVVEEPAPQPTTVRCWIAQRAWDEAHGRDAEAEGWLVEPVAGTVLDWTDAAPWETALVPAGPVLAELRKVCTRVGVTLHESDTMPPPPHTPQSVRVNGLGPGDIIEMDGSRVVVGGVDAEGFAWCEPDARGCLTGEVERALWSEVEHVEGNRWRVRPVRTDETPAQQREAARPKRVAKAPKARPARLTPEPEADALTRHGERCVVAQLHEGGAWELVWCDSMPGEMAYETAWSAVVEQAHRARRYDRGGHCAADTRDTARAEVSRG